MKKFLSYNFHSWKKYDLRVFLKFSVSIECTKLYDKTFFHIWKLYDVHFWSTRERYPFFFPETAEIDNAFQW